MGQMMMLMPLMFGFFALQVPQGLVLYWVTSNVFMLLQQLFITRNQKPALPVATEEPAPATVPSNPGGASNKPRKRDGKRKKR
jgi:YidC/Oxa1 family membrane protein insertase